MTAANPRLRPLLLVAALAVLVFVALPGALYMGNHAEFMTAPLPILRLLLAPAILLVALALIGLRLARTQDFSRFCSVVAALTLLVWVQAYVLVWDYGLLDGSPIDWGTPAWRGWVDAGVWLAGLGAAFALHRRLGGPLATAAIVVVAMQVGLLLVDAFAHRDVLALKATRRLAATGLEAMGRFSSGRNVVHIVLDSFQADVFKDIVTGPGGAGIQAALPGFTWFEEHLGTFPATYLALPVIVSGQVYRNEVPRAAFIESAYAGKSLFNAAHDAGFEVDLASNSLMLDLLMKGRFDNAYLAEQLPLTHEAARLLDLALFRLAPHALKPLVYNDQRWLTQRLASRTGLEQFSYFAHNAFLAHITKAFAADRQAPVYKFFHLMTTHAPFVVNPDCSASESVLERNRENVTAQSRCSLAFVVALLNRMKAAGIYDNSLVVIMGDHGGHIPPHRYRPGTIVQDGMKYALQPDFIGLATPLLAIKPPGATGPFETSGAFTSMTDVPATIAGLLGLDAGLPGRAIWDNGFDPAAERRFFGYQWSKLDAVSEYIELIQEFTVSGSAYQIESWHVAAFHLPPEP